MTLLYDAAGGLYGSQNGLYELDRNGLIASFEDDEFDDAWSGRKDTINGDLTTTQIRAVDGTTSLRHPADGGYGAMRSDPGDGLDRYLGIPSKQRFYIWFADSSQANANWYFCRRNNGNDHLRVRLWGANNRLFFYESVDGSFESIARDNSPTYPSQEWLEVTITVNDAAGTAFSGLQALEPEVEVYTIDSDLSRNTEVAYCRGDDGEGDPVSISESNNIAPNVGGYQWTFNSDALADVDYHHQVDV